MLHKLMVVMYRLQSAQAALPVTNPFPLMKELMAGTCCSERLTQRYFHKLPEPYTTMFSQSNGGQTLEKLAENWQVDITLTQK
jgi:hypothetical protein